MTRLPTAFFLVFAVAITAAAQRSGLGITPTCQIRGQVRFSPGQPPPSGVIVTYGGGGGFSGSIEVDRSGKFEFLNLSPGMYSVRVSALGYRSTFQQVSLMNTPKAFVILDLVAVPSGMSTAPPPAGPAPESARKNLENAEQLLAEGNNVDKALDLLKKAIREYPRYTNAYLLMGAAYKSEKNWGEAQKSFRKALDLDQQNASAYIGLGSVENEKKSFPEAEKYLLKAVELAPDSADAQFELGRAYYGQGRWDLADQHVAKANQLRPDSPQQRVFMGNILLRERNAEGALKEFQEAVRLDPDGPLATSARQMIERIETALKQAANQKQ